MWNNRCWHARNMINVRCWSNFGKMQYRYKHYLHWKTKFSVQTFSFQEKRQKYRKQPKVFMVVPWCRCCSCVWSLQQGSWMSRLREKYLGSMELENLWDKICHLQSRGLCVVGRLLLLSASINVAECITRGLQHIGRNIHGRGLLITNMLKYHFWLVFSNCDIDVQSMKILRGKHPNFRLRDNVERSICESTITIML